jgi:ketosteroid isomerase-like protein
MLRLPSILAVCATLGATVPLAAQATPTATRAAIDAANAVAVKAANAGDVARFVSVYTPDAIVMPPGAPAVHGTAAITALWQAEMKAGVQNLSLATTEFTALGTTGIELGTYDFDVKPPAGGATTHDHGKYIVIWKRLATGGWHWARDIFNSDGPAAK